MDNFEKMIMIPQQNLRNILENCLKLANQSAYNENLELKINGEYIKNTNIIDYLLGNNEELKFKKIFEEYIKEKKLYTKLSPIDLKLKNNKNQKHWIQIQ